MKSVPITLFSFASEDYSNAVVQSLFRLGYKVKIVKNPNLNCLSDNLFEGIAVYLFGELTPAQDAIYSLLMDADTATSSKSDTASRLGIFINEHMGLDAHLINYLNEFSSWPCSDEELVLRLDRLGYNFPEQNYSEVDQKILDELVNLNIIGKSPALLKTIHNIKRFTCCNAPLLIEGETGTGKELAARAVHYLSDRRDHPFIPVNCGALPENLVENELFGHEKGAYTDAGKSSSGLIAQAEGGTLFLDEIEALSQKAQVSLLRFLQEKEYRRLGGNRIIKANVRIIAASNAPIHHLVENQNFREDLYYRLNVMTIVLPPLRERGADAGLIAEHYLSTYSAQYNQPDKFLHPTSLNWLNDYHWPGNVRELENMVHRAFLLSEGPEVYLDGIPEYKTDISINKNKVEKICINIETKFNHAKAQVIEQFEKHYLSNILKETKGNITLAAKHAGKERRAFGKLLKKHGISMNTL